MMLIKLNFADTYRDGGSYAASFETDRGLTYNIWLQRSKMPDGDGLHHRWLFEYFGAERPQACLPIVTESEQERALVGRLRQFLAREKIEVARSLEQANPDRLTELIHYIERREPCFPSDLVAGQLEAR
jgi:hypothetical protein